MHKPHRRRFRPSTLARGFIARPKLYYAIGCAALALLVMPQSLPSSARAAAAWNIGGLVYLILAFGLFRSCRVDEIRQRAAREDESAIVFLLLILTAIASSFSATIGLIGEAKVAKGQMAALLLGLSGMTILVSWTVTQIVFTLHYAHSFYQPVEGSTDTQRGLKFPEDDHPDYWDFFYFTTSIGATSQTSDVAITSKSLRRLVAFQAVLSFVFNTTVLALAINLAASLI
ncbi:MAG: DUF1345 domain-containing protein [Hyphomicrobiaceae bacterium]